MKVLMGEYHHSIDEKGRIIIPSKLREKLGDTFILTRGLDGCLFIYPLFEWETIIEKYKNLPNIKEARNFMRFFLSGAVNIEPDKQGRINIQIPLINYANLQKECVIIGVNDHLEIWAKEKWDDFISANEEDFSKMADDIFSNF